jgi:hypothetical protein
MGCRWRGSPRSPDMTSRGTVWRVSCQPGLDSTLRSRGNPALTRKRQPSGGKTGERARCEQLVVNDFRRRQVWLSYYASGRRGEFEASATGPLSSLSSNARSNSRNCVLKDASSTPWEVSNRRSPGLSVESVMSTRLAGAPHSSRVFETLDSRAGCIRTRLISRDCSLDKPLSPAPPWRWGSPPPRDG